MTGLPELPAGSAVDRWWASKDAAGQQKTPRHRMVTKGLRAVAVGAAMAR
jgi:hypothetical protein